MEDTKVLHPEEEEEEEEEGVTDHEDRPPARMGLSSRRCGRGIRSL